MPDPKTYVGTCHCGKLKFEATMVLESAMDCNCSIDSRTAAVMAPVPALIDNPAGRPVALHAYGVVPPEAITRAE